MPENEKRKIGRRSGRDRRSGIDSRTEEERKRIGERRFSKDRRSGLDRRLPPVVPDAKPEQK